MKNIAIKWSKPKHQQFYSNYQRTARKEGFRIVLLYDSTKDFYYFMLEDTRQKSKSNPNMNKMYNSLWKEKVGYKTEADCMRACERTICRFRGL